MKTILFVHILAGYMAVLAGYAAVFAPKGKTLHRRAGWLFVGAILVMGFGAVVVGLDRDLITWAGGITVAYFVITAVITVRRNIEPSLLRDGALMLVPIAFGLRSLNGGFVALASPGGQIQGIPAFAIFMSAIVLLLAAAGDARVLLRGPLRGSQRLARHLWRMCYALFSATGSFFLVESRVPEFMRITPLRFVLAFLPAALLFYWLWRVRGKQNARGMMTAKPIYQESVT